MSISNENQNRTALLVVAWTVMLLVSLLPVVILQEIFHIPIPYQSRVQVSLAFLLLMLGSSYVWKALRPLRDYFVVFIILYAAEGFFYGLVGNLPTLEPYLESKAFVPTMMANQLLRMAVSLVMLAGLMVIKRKREAFYLVRGNLGATADPIPLIMAKPNSWRKLGVILSLVVSLGTLTFLLIAAYPSLSAQFKSGGLGGFSAQTLVLILLVLLFAAMNAFSEELTYKASFLSVLVDPLGRRQALLIMAAFFGIGHYYGIPYGIAGVLMAAFLGWLLGKSMLETKGFFWAWFIHFLQDVLIFSFLAIGSVTPGGQ